MRLTGAICGIGDPLVAAYARCYLCRVGRCLKHCGVIYFNPPVDLLLLCPQVGMSLAPEAHEHVLENFWHFLLTYPQVSTPGCGSEA